MPSFGLLILLLIIALPLLEIALLIKVGAMIGVWPTLLIILATGIVGLTVFQQQGVGVARRAYDRMQSGEPPLEPMIESGLLAFAGGCLIAPGLITDAIGLVLLIPPVRQSIARMIARRGDFFAVHIHRETGFPGRGGGENATIDGSFERLEERDIPRPRQPDEPRLK